MRFLSVAVMVVLLASIAKADGVRKGMRVEDVRTALGTPNSMLSRGGHEIWLYPQGGRVDFEAGVVVDLDKVPRYTAPEVPTPAPAAGSAGAAGPETSGGLGTEPVAAAAVAAAEDEEGKTVEFLENLPSNPAQLIGRSKELTSLMGGGGEGGEGAAKPGGGRAAGPPDPPPSALRVWAMWLGEALAGAGVTVVVLKGAFAWSDIHADWAQMIFPTVADAVTKLAVVVIAKFALGTSQVFHLDYALSYLVLLVVLIKTTHASSWQRAVSVAAVAKVATVVVWSLLSVVVLAVMAT